MKRNPWESPSHAHKFGGYLFAPPRECNRAKYIINGPDEYQWIDILICARCNNQCDHFLAYKKTWKRWTGGGKIPTTEDIKRRSRE